MPNMANTISTKMLQMHFDKPIKQVEEKGPLFITSHSNGTYISIPGMIRCSGKYNCQGSLLAKVRVKCLIPCVLLSELILPNADRVPWKCSLALDSN